MDLDGGKRRERFEVKVTLTMEVAMDLISNGPADHNTMAGPSA
jgi:hypothetical protein